MAHKHLTKKDIYALKKTRFQLETSLGFCVKTTEGYWKIITKIKHPSISGKERSVKKCLSGPDEIRVSKKDSSVYLFYRKIKTKYLCVVVRRRERESFIITSYLTDKIKEGELKWKR